MRNLISNAIKFSHKNTVVMVHVKVQDVMDENKTEEGNGKEVLVTVSDRGCGIKKEDQGKLLMRPRISRPLVRIARKAPVWAYYCVKIS